MSIFSLMPEDWLMAKGKSAWRRSYGRQRATPKSKCLVLDMSKANLIVDEHDKPKRLSHRSTRCHRKHAAEIDLAHFYNSKLEEYSDEQCVVVEVATSPMRALQELDAACAVETEVKVKTEHAFEKDLFEKCYVDAGVQCSVVEHGKEMGLFKNPFERGQIIRQYSKPFRQHVQLQEDDDPYGHDDSSQGRSSVCEQHIDTVAKKERMFKDCSQPLYYRVHTEREIRENNNPGTIDHFSLYESPETIAAFASKLSPVELRILVDRLLGNQICGMCFKGRKGRSYSEWIRVGERYVEEALLIAQAAPSFQDALEKSANALLFEGIEGLALHKTTLISLAHEQPERWGGRARTALDFAARLVKAGAIRNISSEMIDRQSNELHDFCESVECSGAASHKPASEKEEDVEGDETFTPELQRTLSSPAAIGTCAQPMIAVDVLPRSFSTPTPFVRSSHLRSIGTSLRPEDRFQYCYSRVSFPKVISEDIPSSISLKDLPDYWRHVAGGNLTPEEIEARAQAAEHDLKHEG